MPTVKLSARHKVRLPAEAVRALRLRKGTQLDVHVTDDAVVLVPSSRVPKGQRYFWTQEWQKKEREADEAISRGEVLGPFQDAGAAAASRRPGGDRARSHTGSTTPRSSLA
jgi:antitoxin component of MazEF toxin-antitoxin module